MSKIKRIYGVGGRVLRHTDVELVAQYLEGWVDPYEGGAAEQACVRINNIARNTAEILLKMDRKTVLEICEES